MMAQLKFQQQLAQAESEKANAQRMNVTLKAQVEKANNLLKLKDQQSKLELEKLKQQIDAAEVAEKVDIENQKLAHQRWKDRHEIALKLTELEQAAKAQKDAELQQNKETVSEAS
jgi:hypothetical protein